MDTNSEPVRVTNWITAAVTAVIGAAIVYLQTNDWRAAALSALAAAAGLVGAGEVARQQVVSPRTLELNTGKKLDQLK
jgi:hypothetical protein